MQKSVECGVMQYSPPAVGGRVCCSPVAGGGGDSWGLFLTRLTRLPRRLEGLY